MIKILGIDPSTNDVGIAILYINEENFKIESIKTTTIVLSRVEQYILNNDAMSSRLNCLRKDLEKILDVFKPDIVAYENPFIDKFKMSSAIPLGRSIGVIEMSIQNYRENMSIIKYSPRSVKKVVGAVKAKGKEPMLEAVSKINEIASKIEAIDYLTDHEIDAVSIGYALLLDVRQNPLVLV